MTKEYADSLKDLKKLALSLKSSLTKITKSLEDDIPQETKEKYREERVKEKFEISKKRYKFTEREKNELLDELINLWNLTNISEGYMQYELGDFLKDNSPDFQQKAEIIMEKARNQIEDLLPPALASLSKNKKNFQQLYRFNGRRKNFIEEEEEEDEEDGNFIV